VRFDTELKAEAVAAAIKAATGVRAVVRDAGKYAEITFGPADQVALRAWIEKQLTAKPSGDVRFNLGPVVHPLVLRKALPFLLGAAAAGFLLSRAVD
jgi:hypothetical protein